MSTPPNATERQLKPLRARAEKAENERDAAEWLLRECMPYFSSSQHSAAQGMSTRINNYFRERKST